MLFIGILALVLIGPKQLPTVARNVGRFLNELRRASEGIFSEFKNPIEEIKKPIVKQEPKAEDETHNRRS